MIHKARAPRSAPAPAHRMAHALRYAATPRQLRFARRRLSALARASSVTLPSQSGRVILVTGATDGIGRHTASRLAAAGATVLVHGRSVARVADTVAALRSAGGQARGFVADLSSLDDTRRLAREVADAAPELHTLINNAGVFAPSGEQRSVTADGLETTFAVNVAAPFLLGAALLPRLRAAPGGGLLCNTASISHAGVGRALPLDTLQGEGRFSSHYAYSLSKLCVVMFTIAQARRLAASGDAVRAVTLDPGTVNTKMLLAGWGPCGMEVADADDTCWAATAAVESGAYYVGRRAATPDTPARDEAAQEALWQRLVALTGVDWA